MPSRACAWSKRASSSTLKTLASCFSVFASATCAPLKDFSSASISSLACLMLPMSSCSTLSSSLRSAFKSFTCLARKLWSSSLAELTLEFCASNVALTASCAFLRRSTSWSALVVTKLSMAIFFSCLGVGSSNIDGLSLLSLSLSNLAKSSADFSSCVALSYFLWIGIISCSILTIFSSESAINFSSFFATSAAASSLGESGGFSPPATTHWPSRKMALSSASHVSFVTICLPLQSTAMTPGIRLRRSDRIFCSAMAARSFCS
mmetsp:Transcript_52798/g.98958  ORF Transcript_52798/g.98958 Transcript_52798/m.98958 type:complete len:263 (-) Transcript_52798:123-911(-)